MYWNRYMVGFGLMLLLSAGFIYFFGANRPLPISSRVHKEKFWADKVHSKKRYHVIVAGDSRVYRGLDPESVSAEVGNLSVLNFGFSSGGFNDEMFSEINKRLAPNTNSKMVVLGITPYSLTPKAQENQHFKQENERDPREVFARRYINPFFSFFDPVAPTDLFRNTDTISGYHESFHKHGWVASYKLPLNSEAALKSYVKNFKDNFVQPRVIENLCRQISIWQSEGIQVYAFRVPSTLAMETLENSLSEFEEEVVKAKIEKAGGVWLEIENRYGYVTYDGSHLTEESAVAFSRYLGKRIFKSEQSSKQ